MSLSTVVRRVRGAVSLATTWAFTWGIAAGAIGGLGTALILRAQDFPVSVMSLVRAFAIAGAITGAVSGLGFAIIVATSGRRRSLSELSPGRLGLWSALPALGIGLALFGVDPFFVAATAVFGFGAGAATVRLARRAETLSLTRGEQTALPTST